MIKDTRLLFWENMVESLFMILILRVDVQFMMKKFNLQREMDMIQLVSLTIQMELQLIMNILLFMMTCLTEF